MRRVGHLRYRLLFACLLLTLLLPAGGCGDDAEGIRDDLVQTAQETWCVVRDEATGAWSCVQTTTEEGMAVLGHLAEQGADAASETAEAVFVWSKDRASDGFAWIRAQSADAATWAQDTASEVWMVTKDAANDACLWVKTEALEGLAWVRVEIPAAWRLTKDAAGTAWVWIRDHKFAATAVATIVRIILGKMFVVPIATLQALARATTGGASAVGGHFLASLYRQRVQEIEPVTLAGFLEVGESIVTDLAADVSGIRGAMSEAE